MTHIPGHIGTTDGGGDTNTLPIGSLIRDAQGNVWEVTTAVAAKLVSGNLPGAQFRRFDSIIRTVGRFFETETGRAIELNPSGTFRQLTVRETDVLFPTGSGGAGRAAPAFGSTQAGAQLQIQAAADAAKLLADARIAELEAAEEQAEIDRELRLREARLTTARDLVNIRSAEAREARTQGVSLAGEDPFKFTAIARGLAGPTGTTPSAAFKGNLAQAGNFQAPELAGLDSAALESVIAKLSQLDLSPQQPFGFAHGGTTRIPTSGSVSIDVGEPINGMPNPETVILRPDGTVEVVQKAGSAQTGGVFDFGGFAPLFSSLRRASGTGGGFLTTPGLGGNTIGLNDILNPSQASALGARQRGLGSFVSTPGQPVFIVTESGLRPISSPDVLRALGGNLADVESLTAGQFNRLRSGFGVGEDFRDVGAAGSFRPARREGAFGAFGQPLTTFQGQRDLAAAIPDFSVQDADRISQLIGFLPAPHKIPPAFFQALSPEEKNVLIKAYRLAGVKEADFTFFRQAPQLSATPQRATAVG